MTTIIEKVCLKDIYHKHNISSYNFPKLKITLQNQLDYDTTSNSILLNTFSHIQTKKDNIPQQALWVNKLKLLDKI